tara:strand:+ start:550 stop:786 length:237 start_codon:yes stop_codon:yes gene_type:complete
MNIQDKTAIENLVIIASYMQENSVLTSEDEKILQQSIAQASKLIGLTLDDVPESINLCEIGEFDIDAIVTAIKNRKSS